MLQVGASSRLRTYTRLDLCEKRRWLMQSVMFMLGTLAGCYMAYLVNRVRMSARRP